MPQFAADENISRRLVAALRRRLPDLDVARIQDAGLSGAPDPTVLAWAADENRIVLSHDRATMATAAYARVAARLRMPGVFLLADDLPIGAVVDEIADIVELG